MKKNVPYKVLQYLGILLAVLAAINIAGVWVGWFGRETTTVYANTGAILFGVISGILVLLNLIVCAIIAFINQRAEKRSHGWIYAALGAVHLTFVILTFTISRGEDKSCPALFTVFLIAMIGLLVYLALAKKKPDSIFEMKNTEQGLAPIHREDLGSNPTESTIDQVANPENNPDRVSGRDEKTGIVSL